MMSAHMHDDGEALQQSRLVSMTAGCLTVFGVLSGVVAVALLIGPSSGGSVTDAFAAWTGLGLAVVAAGSVVVGLLLVRQPTVARRAAAALTAFLGLVLTAIASSGELTAGLVRGIAVLASLVAILAVVLLLLGGRRSGSGRSRL